MQVAFGFKAHSGWAVLVAVGRIREGAIQFVERRRIELIGDRDPDWPGQPYHAAREQTPDRAEAVVQRGIADARRSALAELHSALGRARKGEHRVVACAVLVPEPMPDWNTREILAVHFRMHRAEGALFPDALLRAAATCNLCVVAVPEKRLQVQAGQALAMPRRVLDDRITALGRSAGPPWGRDQKNAALAAMLALHAPRA